MIIDCHVHVSAATPSHGWMSPTILKSVPFRFMRWRLGLGEYGQQTEQDLEKMLAELLAQTAELDAAAILAFDAVYDRAGRRDDARTHLYVTNDYVIELCRRHRKMLFAASIHPYRKDAVAELERCAKAGAVLLKWLPIVQDIDPADSRCFEFYEALAHYRIPLLSHTGGEKTLPNLNISVADPALLIPALKRGVTVIAAHCGTRSVPGETDYLPVFMRMAEEFENFYGDTAALCVPTRSYGIGPLLKSKTVRQKLVHGSDWPVISLPPAMTLRWADTLRLMRDRNWIRRDIHAKQLLGFDDSYWHRAARILRLPKYDEV